MGSIQMISLGIIGEYLRLIFLESKGRPTYLVASYRRGTGTRGRREGRAARADHAHDRLF
jgi:dolichol-phosphate mannosyltransferase